MGKLLLDSIFECHPSEDEFVSFSESGELGVQDSGPMATAAQLTPQTAKELGEVLIAWANKNRSKLKQLCGDGAGLLRNCGTCTGKPTENKHPCPYEADVENNPSPWCYCCDACVEECARSI